VHKREQRVHFQWLDNLDEQQADLQGSSPPIKKLKRFINFDKLRLQVLDLFRNDQYVTLLPDFIQEVLPSRQLQQEFFSAQGHNILSFLLTYKHELSALHLLVKLFSIESLQEAIKKENFMCLKKFLISQCSQETFSKDSDRERALRIEKYKFLLSLDHAIVKDYFEHPDPNFITKKIQADFVTAIQSIEQNKDFLRISL
jgi:hypothetical protein